MTLLSASVLLFFVMDPLGNVPLFLAALRHVEQRRVRTVIVRELIIALAIMVVFLFVGRFMFPAVRRLQGWDRLDGRRRRSNLFGTAQRPYERRGIAKSRPGTRHEGAGETIAEL